jgi:hypothetical protein
MASAGLPPADTHNTEAAAPFDRGGELHRALAAAEELLLGACATPSAVAALGDTSALLRRLDAVSAAAASLRSALVAQQPAADGAAGADCATQSVDFLSLPHSLVVRVLAALPADARLRCAEVCRAWRAAVSDRTLWLRVNLSPEGGVTHAVNDSLLRAVSARACGHVQALALRLTENVTNDTFFAVLQANSSTLRELDTALWKDDGYFRAALVQRVMGAAPQLQVFHSSVAATVRDVVRMLRNEAPFGPLHVRHLKVFAKKEEGAEEEEEEAEEPIDGADLLALAAAMRQHASLQGFRLQDVPLDTPAVLDAFIDVALERRLSELWMDRCSLSPASAPALARLLGSAALTELWILNNGSQLLDAAAAALLADALWASTTLRVLKLDFVDLFRDVTAGVAVLRALTAHPSLRVLWLYHNPPLTVYDAVAFGAVLGALVAADAPALQALDVSYCALGDAGLAPFFDALPANTHLRELYCGNNGMSDAFASDTFLPAIRANTSLRVLVASEWWGDEEDGAAPEEVLQAEALVKARAGADAAATVPAA